MSVAPDIVNITGPGMFFDILAPGEPVTFQTFDDAKKGRPLAHVLHGQFHALHDELACLNKQGAGIFVSVNRTDGKGRKSENVVAIRALFLDLDGAPLEPVMAARPLPHVIVETSPGRFHCIWRVQDCPLDRFTPLQKALAKRFNGDPACCDLARVCRVPGFMHQKGKPFCSCVVYDSNADPYTVADIIGGLQLAESAEAKPEPLTDGSGASSPRHIDVEALISKVQAGDGWHDNVLRIVAHCVGAGWPDEAILTLAERLTRPDYTIDNTRADLKLMIDGARAKGWAPPPDDEDDKKAAALRAEIERLAKLTASAYAIQRKKVAIAFGVPLGLVDKMADGLRKQTAGPVPGPGQPLDWPDIEPWLEPVNGAALLNEIVAVFAGYMVMSSTAKDAAALWCLHAHALDAADFAPILAIKSPEKRCGKSRLFSIVNRLVPRPLLSSNMTISTIFRTIDEYRPTLLMDEGDSFLPADEGMRGVLNSGHARDAAWVVRNIETPHGYEPRKFSTWAAKATSGIGKLPETLEDRAITINLKRKLPSETIPKLRRPELKALAQIHARIIRWITDNLDGLKGKYPNAPAELHDRAADNWEPLLAIAAQAGGDWPERAQMAAIESTAGGADDREGMGTMLLADVRQAFGWPDGKPEAAAVMTDSKEKGPRISSEAMVAWLVSLEGRPWAEIGKAGKPITKNRLARLLAKFKITPGTIRLGSDDTLKGYYQTQFKDAFERYLPPLPPLHTVTTSQA